MNDKLLRDNIIEELDWEPSVDSADIGVTVDDGIVTLSGHVPSYAQKITAEQVVRRLKGVKAIVQKVEVRVSDFDSDEALARRAANVLDWNVTVPKNAVQVRVGDRFITLTGEVEWEFQRRAAEEAIRKLGGIMGVSNQIALKPRVQPSDLRRRIQSALDRYANIEAGHVNVDVIDGKVILTGKVKSWAEHNVIEDAVWAAPGVRTVEDKVAVV